MTDTNTHRYDWKELKSYLEGFVQHGADRFTNESAEWMEEMGWTEHDARKNVVENLRESLTIIFPNELIDIEV